MLQEVLSQISYEVLDMLAQDQRRHALCLAYHRAYHQDQISNGAQLDNLVNSNHDIPR